jgi:uncharacterized protein (DUF427 family)
VIKRVGPDHPITVEPTSDRVVVRAGDRVVADSRAALVLREASYPPVYYLPPEDVDHAALRPSPKSTYCPYKGDAGHYSVLAGADGAVDSESGAGAIADAAWTYPHPYPDVAPIAGHLAFYPDRVQISVERS